MTNTHCNEILPIKMIVSILGLSCPNHFIHPTAPHPGIGGWLAGRQVFGLMANLVFLLSCGGSACRTDEGSFQVSSDQGSPELPIHALDSLLVISSLIFCLQP